MVIGPADDPMGPLLQLDVAPPSSLHAVQGWLVRQAVKGWLPLRSFWPATALEAAPRTGRLSIELVSHCWGYSHLLECQLGSLVAAPPASVDVTMTVYHSAEDRRTVDLLALTAEQRVPGVRWNWRNVPPEQLFRRSIGRNHAALATEADWIWFTDCDVLFTRGCLDGLADALQGRTDPLVYPSAELLTALLPEEAVRGGEAPALRDVADELDFVEVPVTRAKGPLQITHGDVARANGYCREIAAFQRPEESFAKCHEDTAFRWLLGTPGTPIEVPGLARIRHLAKGRYGEAGALRRAVRRLQERLRHPA